MSKFSDRLKELRIQSNKKQTELAEYLGVLPRTIRFYESGDREPNIESINKLTDYFGVTSDYLLGRKNYWIDSDDNINVKITPDIFSADNLEKTKKKK